MPLYKIDGKEFELRPYSEITFETAEMIDKLFSLPAGASAFQNGNIPPTMKLDDPELFFKSALRCKDEAGYDFSNFYKKLSPANLGEIIYDYIIGREEFMLNLGEFYLSLGKQKITVLRERNNQPSNTLNRTGEA